MNSRVWNRGSNEYSEKYKGKIITIQPGKFVLMNTYDAAAFNGQYPGKGVAKMLEVEDISDKGPEQPLVICNFCGASFASTSELNNHIGIHKPQQIVQQEDVPRETEKFSGKRSQIHRGWPKGKPRKAVVVNDSSSNTANSQGSD